MVKVAIAGANGALAKELIDRLVANKHEILALVRKDPESLETHPGLRYIKTDYQDKEELVKLFRDEGVETVVSFFTAHLDENCAGQKRLIDASIEAGVKRFIPSEFAYGTALEKVMDLITWYENKMVTRKYLEEINREKKVIEYTLITPGTFMDYLGWPHNTTKHVAVFPPYWEFDTMKGMVIEGHEDDEISFTTVNDIANTVVRAIEYEGEWPVVGGVRGETIKISDMLREAERLRGKKMQITKLKLEDLEANKFQFPEGWVSPGHASIPEEERKEMMRYVVQQLMIAISRGVGTVSDEWNRLFPDYHYTTVREYLQQVWGPK